VNERSSRGSPTTEKKKRFEGSDNYVATDDLRVAVNAADRAGAAAAGQGRARNRQDHAGRWKSPRALGMPIIEWHIKSTTKAHQGLYEV